MPLVESWHVGLNTDLELEVGVSEMMLLRKIRSLKWLDSLERVI